MSEPIHCDFCGEAGASWLTLPDLSSAEQRHPLTGYACRKCALEQMTKASGGALIPAAPSAAVRETLLYRVLNSDAWRNNPQWQQAADVFGLPPAMRLLQLHNADNTLTPAGRTIIAALEGNGQIAQPSDMVPRAALQWLATKIAAILLTPQCETDREYSRAHEDADTFLRDAYEATTGTVPNAQETTQE